MRTKTLLLTAALGAAGIATSSAQVFSVNAVGYVTKTVPAGKFALISNPLNAADNTIDKLFAGLPAGTQIFKYDGKAYAQGTFDDFDNNYGPLGKQTLVPGEGVFVKNNSTADINITFVGEVPQGDLKNPIPQGLSIRSSQVPQAGNLNVLGLKGAPGDQVFKFNVTAQGYQPAAYDDFDNKWPDTLTVDVGEAFFIQKAAAGSWDRTFNVNQ
jgi:hypothetical protein